jgi:hypothetical protein
VVVSDVVMSPSQLGEESTGDDAGGREGRHRRLGVGFWEPTDHLDQESRGERD